MKMEMELDVDTNAGRIKKGNRLSRNGQRGSDDVWSHDKFSNKQRRLSNGQEVLAVVSNLHWNVTEADLKELFGYFFFSTPYSNSQQSLIHKWVQIRSGEGQDCQD